MKDKETLISLFSDFLEKHFGGSQENHKLDITKAVDNEQRRALFVVLEPQNSIDDVQDLHDDYYDEVTIEKACIDFNTHCQKAGLFHEIEVDNDLIEIEQSFINPSEFTMLNAEGKEVVIKKGAWLMSLHFPETNGDDLIWQGVKSGEFNGLSVQCGGSGIIL